jgi:DNA primase
MLVAFSYARFPDENSTVSEDVEKLKQRRPLLDYLRQQNWEASPAGHGSPEFVGLCPLHQETQPSFYVNARKNLFYCQGCGPRTTQLQVIKRVTPRRLTSESNCFTSRPVIYVA